MTIQETHTYLAFIIDKSTAAYHPPPEYDIVLHRAQLAVFNIFFDDFVKTQFVHSALNPFRKSIIRSTTDTPAGVVTLPSDYAYATRLMRPSFDNDKGITTNRTVHLLKSSQLSDAINSQVRPVTLEQPIAESTGELTLQLYPQKANTIKIDYVSRPPAPVFNYTQSGRVITFVPTGSVNLLWADNYCNMIMNKALEMLGVNLSDGDLVQYLQGETMASLNSKDKS